MSGYGFLGILVGILIGLVIVCISVKKLNNDSKFNTKYDERQNIVRGQGYKYGFWTGIILMVVVVLLKSYYEGKKAVFPLTDLSIVITICFLMILVQVGYCIMNDGYFGLNNNRRRYYIYFIIVGIYNILVGYGNMRRKGLLENGQLGLAYVSFLTGGLIVIIGILLLIKKLLDNRTAEDDEEDEEADG